MKKDKKSNAKIDILFIIDGNGTAPSIIKSCQNNLEDYIIDLSRKYSRIIFKYGFILYHTIEYPDDQCKIMYFDDEIENISIFIDEIDEYQNNKQSTSKGKQRSEVSDYAGALFHALNLPWCDGKKIIFWISDSSAYGKKYCGSDEYQEEEQKLDHFTQLLACKKFNLITISLNEKAEKTFKEMKKIYNFYSPGYFMINSISNEKTVADLFFESSQELIDKLYHIESYSSYFPYKFEALTDDLI